MTGSVYIDMIGNASRPTVPDAAPDAVDLHDPATYYADIQRVLDHFNDHTPDYEKAKDFSQGNVHEFFASDYIREILEETGDAYLCNFAGKVIDAVADRLEIQSVQLRTNSDEVASPYLNTSLGSSVDGFGGAADPTLASGAEPDPAPADRAGTNQATDAARDAVLGHSAADDPDAQSAAGTANNDVLPAKATKQTVSLTASTVSTVSTSKTTAGLQRTWDTIYRQNKLANFFARWIKKSLVFGDSYALGWDNGAGGVQCQVLDPLTTAVIYDEENDEVELFGCRWFETSDGRKRMNLYYDGWIVKLVTKARSAGEKPQDYIPYVDPLDELVPEPLDVQRAGRPPGTPYPFVPDNALLDPSTSVGLRYATLAAEQVLVETPGAGPGNGGLPAAPAGSVLEQLSDQQALAHAAQGLWPVRNPHRRQPIFRLPTTDDDCYGVPEHYNAYGPQNAINKLIAVQMDTTDAVGFPSRYALQKSGTIDQNAFDEPEDEELPPDRDVSVVEDRPGTVNLLKDVDQLIQLAGADPDGFLKPMMKYIQFMSFVCSTPMSFYDTLGQMPSDSTQRENTGPLIKKCGARKRVMTPTIEAFVEFLFSILGHDDVVVHVQWAQSQMIDDLAGWQVLTGKLAAGIPFTQVMQEAGYTLAQIASWPTPSTGMTSRVAMALQIAQAAQALAASTAAGVMDPAKAQALIDQMIEDLNNTPIDTSSRANVSFRG